MQVHAFDLKLLARATGCSEYELMRAIHNADSSFEAVGTMATPAQEIAFASDQTHSPRRPAETTGVKSALISLAARPGVLDKGLPKCLTPVGNLPLIGHVLGQLPPSSSPSPSPSP